MCRSVSRALPANVYDDRDYCDYRDYDLDFERDHEKRAGPEWARRFKVHEVLTSSKLRQPEYSLLIAGYDVCSILDSGLFPTKLNELQF